MHLVFLSVGSNLGHRKANIRKAIGFLNLLPGRILEVSSLYETEPWGCCHSLNFYNQVVKLSTSLNPLELLEQLHQIEIRCGRVPSAERYAPRKIDLDILLYEDRIIESEGLKIPHPLLPDRKFVLVPLDEIAPDALHPLLNKSIHQLLEECTDLKQVLKTG